MSLSNIQQAVHHHPFGQPLTCHLFTELFCNLLEDGLLRVLRSQRHIPPAIRQDLGGTLPKLAFVSNFGAGRVDRGDLIQHLERHRGSRRLVGLPICLQRRSTQC